MTNPRRDQSCREFLTANQAGRRQVLQAGALGMLGLGLTDLWQRAEGANAPSARPPGFGKAKRCIFLFMWGGPSQLETFDLKPDAPTEVRGSFKPISTNVPGLAIGEYFTRLSQQMDKVAVIRSLCHDDPAHLSTGHLALTGHYAPVIRSDDTPPSERDSPHVGSVLAKLRGASGSLPPFVTMPWKAFHPAAPGGTAPGQHGGWLGSNYDPLLLTGDPNDRNWKIPALGLLDGLSAERLSSRHELLKSLDGQRAALDNASSMSGKQERALGLLASPEVRQAFDLSREPAAVRDRYGRNIHGQCVLLARRLVEHGVPLVSVNWHNDGKTFWDTHGDNFNRLKKDLIPPADRALAALLGDLQERGLLDETIVAWVGEFGRKPQISTKNSGREHWPYCYNGLLAGGGIAGGAVYGASDKIAAYPSEHPVSPQDYAATLLHALGVSADTVLHDRSGRPHHVYGGKPIEALFA